MATKVYCDGCDEHILEPHRITKVAIAYELKPWLQGMKDDEFDLCSSCIETFRLNHLPKRWPRARVGEK